MATVGSVTGLLTKTGIGGLSSGMDIDALVTKMTATSREKITKQEQSLQVLEWKQSAYRSVTKALTEFRDKYFNALSATNFKSSALYNTIRAALPTDTKEFTATAQSNAVSGKAYVNSIQQLATSQSVTNKYPMSKALETDVTSTNLGEFAKKTTSGNQRDFMITLDGVSRTVVIDDDFVNELKRAAYKDTHSGAEPPTPADRDAVDLDLISSPTKQAEYLKDALQIRVNKLFENPTDSEPPKITVTNSSAGKIGFSTRDGSKLTLGYATAPVSVKDTNADGTPVPKDEYNDRVEAMHKDTGLGALGFSKGDSNKIDIYSSIASLQGKINGDFVPAGLDPDGHQYVYEGPDGKIRELTNSNFTFSINDVKFSIDPNESVYSLMNKINSSGAGVTLTYSEVTDKFTLTSKTQGRGENIVMGDLNRNLLGALGLQNSDIKVGIKDKDDGHITIQTPNFSNNNADDMEYGKNAIAFIDGQKIERTSNEFTVNGVAYSLKELLNYDKDYDPTKSDLPAGVSATSGTAVTLAPDATDLIKKVKDFITDYNALVDLLHGLTNEEKFRDYEPLTEAQRAAMSESEVKSWEEKAKSGLLRADSTVGKILSSMREAFLGSSDGFSLFNMGITHGSVSSYKNNGKLEITDEAKLKSAIESKPDQVRDFFTNASKGAITKLDKTLDDAVRTTGGQGNRGSLIEMAGLPSTQSEKENSIYTQLLNHSKRIDALKDLLKKEESRLWTKFSAMESALAKLNEQNTMLSQYLGTGKSS